MATTSPQLEAGPWRSAFQPITAVPRSMTPHRRLSPEQELMLAVLRQALDDYGQALTGSHLGARRARCAIERWITADEHEWPFSFANVCDAVGIDRTALRLELRRWRTRRAGRVGPTPTSARRSRLPNRDMRGSRTRVGV